MKKNKISKNWLSKQKRDIYVRRSKLEGYRSRAIYKLKEIDDKFNIIQNGINIGEGIINFLNLFNEKKKEKKNKFQKESDETTQDEVDKILDKISESGYSSLTSKEKERLFNASKKQ